MRKWSRAVWILPLLIPAVAFAQETASQDAAPRPIRIDLAKIVTRSAPGRLGLNLNCLLDGSWLQPGAFDGPPLATALKQLGVNFLRYPGGELADNLLWSRPPFEKPLPTLARADGKTWPSGDARWVNADGSFVKPPLDFDQFITLCRESGAEPVVVVCYDNLYPPAGSAAAPGPTREELIATAVGWVKYANITRGYKVKYWELGSQSWRLRYNGGASAADYAHDLQDFSRAMKAVDASIQIGANGPVTKEAVGERDQLEKRSQPWWEVVLSNSASEFDYLVIDDYPCTGWGGFDAYSTKTQASPLGKVLDRMGETIRYWAPDRPELGVAIAQTSSADLTPPAASKAAATPWAPINNLGHGLVLLDQLLSYASYPQLRYACVWVSRWLEQVAGGVAGSDLEDSELTASKEDTKSLHSPPTARPSLWDTLGSANEPHATGMALKAAAELVGPGREFLAVEPAAGVRTVATLAPQLGHVQIALINQVAVSQRVIVVITNGQIQGEASARVWRGSGPEETKPAWTSWEPVAFEPDNRLLLELAPASLTILQVPVKPNAPEL